jgi:Tol biopolymer transport system component
MVLLYTTIALASPGILASTHKDGNWEIYLIDLKTGDQKNLTNNPGED